VKRLVMPFAVAVFAASGLLWLANEPAGETPHDPGSTFDTSPSGTSLAFGYLQRRAGRGSVRRLTRPLGGAEVEGHATVFRIRAHRLPSAERLEKGTEPSGAPVPFLGGAEEAWVQGGGRLVIALAEARGGLSVALDAAGELPLKVHPLWPEVRTLLPSPRRGLGGPLLDQAVTLFASGRRPLVARIALGAGEVFLVSCPEILENALLSKGDHLALLEGLAGRQRPVYFDEHAHGLSQDVGLLALLVDWGLGPALALLALTGLVVLWRGRARLGPPDDTWEDKRSDAVDLVESLGQLYERALRRDEAAALYHGALRRVVSLRTGLRGAALDKRVRELTGGLAPPQRGKGRDIGEADLDQIVARINRAFGGKLHGHSR
jgi:hypothetical protein